MIYFSEISHKRIVTEDGIIVGKLRDLIFEISSRPVITKIVVSKDHGEDLIIPVSYIRSIDNIITISKSYQIVELADNELFIVRNILDKQIIDIKDNKIVRVNDVVLQDRPHLYLAGVDIGWLGVLRWLKIEHLMIRLFRKINIRLTSSFLSWVDIQPLELARGRVKLKKEEAKMEKIRPEDLADHLERTNILNINKILNILNDDYAAQVIGNLNINYQHALFKLFSPEKAATVISLVDPDEAVDILLTLSPKKREQIIALVPKAKRKEMEYLFRLSKTPIGELITTEYLVVKPQDSVKRIIELVKKYTSEFSLLVYIYVINDEDQLIGVFSIHELLMQQLTTPAYKFMTQNVVVIHLTTPEEIAIKKMLKYKLQAIPVINETKKILGIITIDDISDFIMEKL
ncbi:MAG: CBS domain-containing protein [Candidatus Roizmanbacteria bacterium]